MRLRVEKSCGGKVARNYPFDGMGYGPSLRGPFGLVYE
jgi:hypothetical protein